MQITGKQDNWYVGGCGTYFAVDTSNYNAIKLLVRGYGPKSAVLIIELYDDDNNNYELEPHETVSSEVKADDKFIHTVKINWEGWKVVIIPFDQFVDGNLTIDNSATLSMSASNFTLDLEGNFTITSGTFTPGSGTHNVAGNWDDSNSSGGFTPTDGTITMSGSSKTINTHSGNNFFNITSTGDKTVQSELDINGNLTVSLFTFLVLNDLE